MATLLSGGKVITLIKYPLGYPRQRTWSWPTGPFDLLPSGLLADLDHVEREPGPRVAFAALPPTYLVPDLTWWA
jgi:hypothetical protein